MRRVSEPTYKRFIVGELKRFDESNHVYSRVDRGEVIPLDMIPQDGSSTSAVHRIFTYDPNRKERPGFAPPDYALRWAGRTIDYVARKNLYGREIEPTRQPVEVDDAQEMSDLIKRTARWFGADMVGIASLNRTWIYSHWGDHSVQLGLGGSVGEPLELPEYFTNVIVMAVEMDYHHIRRTPAPEAATDLAYSKMGFIAPSMARFIQELGYHAMPSGNDTALSIPLAVDAGLGELGRNGILITHKYGPRVRICKVFTDLPLVHDKPVDLGVQAFCETCERCAQKCPGQALKRGERTGYAASSGVGEGVARVCKTIEEISALKVGEILVASTTSPTWAPAFQVIGGCVTDIGGTCCHAAIVAREYDMPAVVGTGFATQAIRTGDRIRVDGNTGAVTIIERAAQ